MSQPAAPKMIFEAGDPVAAEIIRNGLVAITEEMKTNLMRTAYNLIIYEALDFTVGLFNAAGDTISIGIGLPMFIRGMSDTVKAKLAKYGVDGLEPGDVLITNDAYIIGSHLNNVTISSPIFHQGELVGFSSCMAHWEDVGGVLNGMTTDIYSEGLQLPILKIVKAGVFNEDLVSIISLNVRIPSKAMGDLRAQIAAVQTGERRFLELIGRYGRDTVLASVAALMDQSAAAARTMVRSIPDGLYEAESFLDDDGVDAGKRIPIRVKVEVTGDEMTIDLSGVSPQVKGFFNSGEGSGVACAQVAFKCLTAPNDQPINDGCFRALKVVLPPGTVVSAVRPAPMRWWMTYPMTVVDTIFKALAAAVPDRVIAGHHADLVALSINGRNPSTGAFYLGFPGLIGGGWGAKHNEDGMSATIGINDGDTHNKTVEQQEARLPILVEAYRLRADSGGAGRHRGGLGTEHVVRALADFTLNAQIDRVDCRPWGLFGGLSALGNEFASVAPDGTEHVFPSGKVLARKFAAGDRYALRSGGGGGYGNPLERSIEAVEHDVREGYVSLEAARDFYGVVLDETSLTADLAVTAALRAELSRAGLPKDQPFTRDIPAGRPANAGKGAPA